jgi:acyl carrier protein
MENGEQPTQVVSIDSVKSTLRQLIAEVTELDPEAISDSSTWDEDIKLPSIAFVELQAAVEETFDIEVDPVEVIELNTFGAVAALIAEKVRSRPC